jgi:hypothetical protein
MPNSAERSNARYAAAQKCLAKCEKPLISGHIRWMLVIPVRRELDYKSGDVPCCVAGYKTVNLPLS